MKTIYALFATRIGDADWKEQLITEVEDRAEAAKQWAKDNGFNRLREVRMDAEEKPDFIKTLKNNS